MRGVSPLSGGVEGVSPSTISIAADAAILFNRYRKATDSSVYCTQLISDESVQAVGNAIPVLHSCTVNLYSKSNYGLNDADYRC